jgi:hypothetical protein
MLMPAIGAGMSAISQISSIGSKPRISNNEGTPPPVEVPGKMMQSILQALSSMSGNSAASNSNATPSSKANPIQELQSFIQSLANAIQSQNESSSSSIGSAPQTSSRHKHTAGIGQLESGIQNLLDEIGNNDSATPSKSTQSLTGLEQSANNLFASLGIPTGNQSLNQFLGALKQGMTGSSAVGNILSTTA